MTTDQATDPSAAPRPFKKTEFGGRPRRRRRRTHHASTTSPPHPTGRLRLFAAVAVTATIIAGLAFTFAVQPLLTERDSLQQDVTRLERDLSTATQELATLQVHRDELVTSRIPGLQRLVFDQTIGVDAGYLRDIIFTLTVQEGRPAYEFRVVLENDSRFDVIPNVSVLLFDELGIQVGTGRVHLDSLANTSGSFTLAPGDVRSYSGRVELADRGEPAYYILQMPTAA